MLIWKKSVPVVFSNYYIYTVLSHFIMEINIALLKQQAGNSSELSSKTGATSATSKCAGGENYFNTTALIFI